MSKELHPVLYRLDRTTISIDLSAGAGAIEFRALPRETLAEIEMVSVSGPAIGGAQVGLYRGHDVTPELYIGSAILPATALGSGDLLAHARPWLHGLECLVVTVTGSAGARLSATAWMRLYTLEWRETHPARNPPAEHVADAAHDEDEYPR